MKQKKSGSPLGTVREGTQIKYMCFLEDLLKAHKTDPKMNINKYVKSQPISDHVAHVMHRHPLNLITLIPVPGSKIKKTIKLHYNEQSNLKRLSILLAQQANAYSQASKIRSKAKKEKEAKKKEMEEKAVKAKEEGKLVISTVNDTEEDIKRKAEELISKFKPEEVQEEIIPSIEDVQEVSRQLDGDDDLSIDLKINLIRDTINDMTKRMTGLIDANIDVLKISKSLNGDVEGIRLHLKSVDRRIKTLEKDDSLPALSDSRIDQTRNGQDKYYYLFGFIPIWRTKEKYAAEDKVIYERSKDA